MKHLICIRILILSMVVLPACSEEGESTNPSTEPIPGIELQHATECKAFDKRTADGFIAASESRLEYRYDFHSRTLSLTHLNAAFNCCPGGLAVNMDLEDNIITIIEREQEAGCYCLCLYDLQCTIHDLEPGTYRIVVIEPYLHDDDAPLSFKVDLREEPTGNSTVPRTHYPWGI